MSERGDREDGFEPERFDEGAADEPAAGPDPGPPGEEDIDPGQDTGESSGLGLTEEFARIEAEIEDEQAGAGPGEAPAVGSPAEGPPGEGVSSEELPGEVPAGEEPPSPEPPGEAPPGEEPHELGSPPDGVPEPTQVSTGGDEHEPPADAEQPGPAGDHAPAGDAPAGPAPPGPGDEQPEPGSEPTPEEEAAQQPPAPAGEELPAEGAADAEQEETVVHSDAVEHPVVRPMPRPALPVGPGGGWIADEELDPKTPKLWLRFLAGSVVIVASMATAVALTGLFFLSDVAAKLQPIPGIQQQLSEVDPGAPQTILIIGSDRREGASQEDQRSDTTMLLRVDPEKDVLSLFSLPRDLKVDIPGLGPAKLNEAYSLGGEKKTLKTVKRFTGLDINHVVEINFSGFADAVNAIDCVYIDVDREYFNDNAGVAPGTLDGFAEIDINAGYQRLCGLKALQYVRYRKTDTDLVRSARQQDFLREARQKVEPKELLGAVIGVGTGNELINIFTEYTRSDIDDEDDVIGILKSFAAMQNVPVNEVHFEGDIGGPDDPFVTSTDEQVEKAIDEFLNGAGTEGQRGGEKATKKKDGEKKKKEKKDPVEEAAVVDTESLSDMKFPTLAERFETDAAKNARRLKIPVFYPTRVVPGSSFGIDSRTYEYENEQDKKESAYKTVIPLTQPSTLVEYYGVMGTTWTDPPILRNPSETREIDGREYLLFFDGGRLRMVGWREKGNSYWLNNTLSQSIGEAEMLAMATTMREA